MTQPLETKRKRFMMKWAGLHPTKRHAPAKRPASLSSAGNDVARPMICMMLRHRDKCFATADLHNSIPCACYLKKRHVRPHTRPRVALVRQR